MSGIGLADTGRQKGEDGGLQRGGREEGEKGDSSVRRNANSDSEGATWGTKRGGEDARSRVRPANFDDH